MADIYWGLRWWIYYNNHIVIYVKDEEKYIY